MLWVPIRHAHVTEPTNPVQRRLFIRCLQRPPRRAAVATTQPPHTQARRFIMIHNFCWLLRIFPPRAVFAFRSAPPTGFLWLPKFHISKTPAAPIIIRGGSPSCSRFSLKPPAAHPSLLVRRHLHRD